MTEKAAAPEPSTRQTLCLAAGIMLAYMLARLHINDTTDFGDGVAGWEHHDLLMTLPRFAGFMLCLAVMFRYGGPRKWGWHAGFSKRGLVLLALAIGGETAYYLSGDRVYTFSFPSLLQGYATTLVVAGFEESLFRGLFFLSLRRRFGAGSAALLSSALFTVFHWGAQPVSEWPQIFAWGMLACSALELGTGLLWVALAHEITDVLWFYFGADGRFGHPAFETASLLIFAVAVGLSLRWILPKPDPYSLLRK